MWYNHGSGSGIGSIISPSSGSCDPGSGSSFTSGSGTFLGLEVELYVKLLRKLRRQSGIWTMESIPFHSQSAGLHSVHLIFLSTF